MASVAIIGGAGYVGLTYAAMLAHRGHQVWGLDVDEAKTAMLSSGQCSIYEPGLEELMRQGLASGRLRFTTSYADAIPDADFVFLCVGTPADQNGRANLQYLACASESLARCLQGHTIVVNKSTVPIGSVNFVERLLERWAPAGTTHAVVSNPEFLREGSAVSDLLNPDRIVLGGTDADALQRVADLYEPLSVPIVATDPRSAELIKYAANAFLATKISFINEIALICERFGADVATVATGIGLDHRIGAAFLNPGIGFGGSCFPKDVRALASMALDAGHESMLLNAVLEINQQMRGLVLDKLEMALDGLSNRTIAVLGLSFKPETDDIREAPSVDLIDGLVAAGARVRLTDPAALRHVANRWCGVDLINDPYAAAMGADALVLVTEWDQYTRLDLNRLANSMRGRVLVDGRRVFTPAAAREAGFHYFGIGHPSGPLLIAEPSYFSSYLSMAAD